MPEIVECSCPVCGGTGELRTAKTGLAYTVCHNGCSQCFSRSHNGSKTMRAKFAKQPAATPAAPGVTPPDSATAPAKKPSRSPLELLGVKS